MHRAVQQIGLAFFELFIGLVLVTSCFAAEEIPPVRLAVVNSFGNSVSVRYFNGTVNAIAKAVLPSRLNVRLYNQDAFLEAARKKDFDLAIASSGLTARMMDESGATALLTVIGRRTPDPNRANAGVIVTRADRDDIKNLSDLRGKTLGVSSTKAFAGFLAVMGEIESEGLNPNSLFKSVTELRVPMNELVQKVVDKEYDVAFIASCLLENMEEVGMIQPGAVKVINEKQDKNFYCRHSTHLYPGWTLSVRPTLDSKVVRKIIEALLALPPDEKEGTYWTVATDYDQMNLLLKRVAVRYLDDRTLSWMFNYYRWYFIGAGVILLLIVLNWFYLAFVIRRKTGELTKKNEENHKIQERIVALEKANTIGIISALVAHDLKQPLGAINNYSEALLRRFTRGKPITSERLREALTEIREESTRASEIVEYVRQMGHKERRERKVFNLFDAVQHTLKIMKSLGRLSVKCTVEGDKAILVYADPLNFEVVLLNLLKNAEEALVGRSSAWIRVRLIKQGKDAQVVVSDNGPQMTDEEFFALSSVGHSSKKDGLGLGLAIVRELLEANGGSLKMERNPTGGLICCASLPLAQEN